MTHLERLDELNQLVTIARTALKETPPDIPLGQAALEQLTERISSLRVEAEKPRPAQDPLPVRPAARTVEPPTASTAQATEYLRAISHDLREAFRPISFFGQLLQEKAGTEIPAECLEYLTFVVDGNQRVAGLLDDVLTLHRIHTQPLNLEALDLQETLQGLTLELREELAHRQARLDLPGRPVPVLADPVRVHELLGHLLKNALKFSPQPVQIRVTAQETSPGTQEVIVEDRGMGIPAHQLEDVFHLFRRLHSRDDYPGNGAGLSFARAIVQRHSGRIWIDSEPGKGTRVHLTLPMPEPASRFEDPSGPEPSNCAELQAESPSLRGG